MMKLKDTNMFKIFVVPIRNAKCIKVMKFNIDAPMFKCFQSTSHSCCFSILESYFESINQIKAAKYISKLIE